MPHISQVSCCLNLSFSKNLKWPPHLSFYKSVSICLIFLFKNIWGYLSIVDLDREGFGEGLELFISLHRVLWHVGVVKLPIVSSELDSVQLDIDVVSRGRDVKIPRDVECGGKSNIVFASGLGPNGKVIDEFLSGGEQVGAYITLYKSGAAEHQT